MKEKIKTYDIADVLKAGYTLEPIKCRECGDATGNVVYNQAVSDAYCQVCGRWQLETATRSIFSPKTKWSFRWPGMFHGGDVPAACTEEEAKKWIREHYGMKKLPNGYELWTRN